MASDLQDKGLQAFVQIDRDAAARLGITPAAIDNALYNAFGQRLVSTIFTQSNQYRVVLEVKPEFGRGPVALDGIYVSATGVSSTTGQGTQGQAAQKNLVATTTTTAASGATTNQVPLSSIATVITRPTSLGVGIIGTAASQRQPILSTDTRRDPRYVVANPETRSEIAAPLIYKGNVIGVIDLEHTRVNYYNEDHQRTLSTLAAQVAISIANARLYRRIHEEEQRLEHDLQMAREVQLRLLPQKPPAPAHAEIAARFFAARSIGGDLYDFLDYGSGRVAIVLGDVSGKASPAALYAALVSGILRSLAPQHLGPAKMLAALNDQLQERKLAAQYVTMLMAVWDDQTRTLTLANAGSIQPLYVTAWSPTGARTTQTLQVEGFPLGLFPDVSYEENRHPHQPRRPPHPLLRWHRRRAQSRGRDVRRRPPLLSRQQSSHRSHLSRIRRRSHPRRRHRFPVRHRPLRRRDRCRPSRHLSPRPHFVTRCPSPESQWPSAPANPIHLHGMSTQIIKPARSLQGSLTLPGDKSISHRYAMLAGLAEGVSTLANFSTGADPHSTLACMAALGAGVEQVDSKIIRVTGLAGHWPTLNATLDCGNSGSTMRMLAGLLAPHPGTYTLIGDHSLTARPMERIRKPLAEMGADISLTDGHAPLTITGKPLKAIHFDTPIASAQVKTAVLFAGLQAEGTTTLNESVRTRDHSEHALKAFGATLSRAGNTLSIPGSQTLKAVDANVPGDLSSAAFFLCAALLFEDSNLVLDALGMNPTRAALLDVVIALGGKINILNVEEHHGELIGTIQVNRAPGGLKGIDIGGPLSAQLIDELPVLAAIAPYTRDGIRIRDAKELRIKESDRIALVARNLKAMGADFTEHEDGLDIPGGQQLHGTVIDSGSDHRIAMAFSIAALRATSETAIEGAEAAAISFPEFFNYLDLLCLR